MSQSGPQTIQVFIRVRKEMNNEKVENTVSVLNNTRLVIRHNDNEFSQEFDQAFGQQSQQQEVFSPVRQLLTQVAQGISLTVFAYGQTGSGKTYTMFGNDWDKQGQQSRFPTVKPQAIFYRDLETDANNAGIIPRVIYELFKLLRQDYNISCSFLQIYNERIYDLLHDVNKPKPLQIHESTIDGIFVDGLSEYAVTNYTDCLTLMKRGESNRIIRQTSMNANSSRSHSIFQLSVGSIKSDQSGQIKVVRFVEKQLAKINLCDLAGSEKINKLEGINAGHMQELKSINQSLTTLGKVIQNLSSHKKLPVPYRESKLTRLLQDSLGGNTQTVLIANIAPGSNNIEETFSTIKFAERAKNIVINVKANTVDATDLMLVQKLQQEIAYLKSLLQLKRTNTNTAELYQRLIQLQQENERLKNKPMKVRDVESLMKENHDMKIEISKIQSSMNNPFGDTMKNDILPPITRTQELNASVNFEYNSTKHSRDEDVQNTVRHSRKPSKSVNEKPTMRQSIAKQRPPFDIQMRVKTRNVSLKTELGIRNQSNSVTLTKVRTKDLELQKEKRRVLERLQALDRLKQLNSYNFEISQSQNKVRYNQSQHLQMIKEVTST